MAATPAAALPDELVEEILLRQPPNEPASLLRASLISKAWGRAISSPAFRRRLHEFHRTPPLLGFLNECDVHPISRFIPTTASSFSLVAPDWRSWRAIDYRHGRALFLSKDLGDPELELLVWEPITGAQRRLPLPELFESFRKIRKSFGWDLIYPGAAVFCAADRCDHRDCHGGPFGLVLVFTNYLHEEEELHIWACVFSSESGTWGKLTSIQSEFFMEFTYQSSVLVGRSLLYFMEDDLLILQYDMSSDSITLLDQPEFMSSSPDIFTIMLTEDGGLGVAEYSQLNLKLWTKEASDGTDAHWVLSRVINLANLLPIGTLLYADNRIGVELVGFVEGTNTIYLHTVTGIFLVELQAEKARKVWDSRVLGKLVPVVSFYTPVPRGEYQDPPLSGPSDEAGGEQQLFDKGSNESDEGDFVNAGLSHAFKTRITSHGEIALECASTALLYKGKATNDPLDDISISASNEESVKGTSSDDDAGNSKTSGSSQKVLRS